MPVIIWSGPAGSIQMDRPEPLSGTGVAILLAYDGHRVIGPGPHIRCTSSGKVAFVQAVGYDSSSYAQAALAGVKTTLRDADLVVEHARPSPLPVTLYPTLTVRRAA